MLTMLYHESGWGQDTQPGSIVRSLARCSQKILTVLLDYQELEAAHIESSGCQYKIIDHIIVMHWRDKETNVSDMNALER